MQGNELYFYNKHQVYSIIVYTDWLCLSNNTIHIHISPIFANFTSKVYEIVIILDVIKQFQRNLHANKK